MPAVSLLKTWQACVIGLGLIVVCVFGSFLFSDKMLFGSDTMGGLDARMTLQSSLDKSHQFPFWFPSRLGGMPSTDALFGDAMYVPTLAINAIMPLYRAIGMRLVLHVFLAGLFFFLLLRRGFGTPLLIAFMGGALYMLNPEYFSHIYPGHDGKMFVITWLPFVVWRMKALVDGPGLLNSTLLGLGIAMSLFSSQIQMSYFMLWGLFLYWIVAAVLAWTKENKPAIVIRLSGFFILAVTLGLAAALIQLLPSFMYVRDAFSVRGVERGFEYAASWSLHWPEAFSLWVPEFGNFLDYYWGDNPFKLNTEYVGAMALLFGVFAIIQKPNKWRIFWGSVAAAALLFALGSHTPLFAIAYNLVPGVKKFRAPSMIMFWFSFASILLSSLFFKDVLLGYFSSLNENRKKSWAKGILIAIGALTALSLLFSLKGFVSGLMQPLSASINETQKARIFEENFSRNFVPALWLWWFFACAACGILWGVVQGKIKPTAFCWAVLAMALVDILRVDAKFIKLVNPKPYFFNEQAVSDVQNEMKQAPLRVFALPGVFPQNGEGAHGLEGIGGFHDNELRWYREFRGDQQDRNYYENLIGFMQDGRPYLKPENLKNGNAFLAIANVKYYLVRQGEELLKIKNDAAFERLSFAKGYAVFDSTQVVMALKTGKYDYRTTVGLQEEPSVKPVPGIDEASGVLDVAWQAYTPNYRKAKIKSPDNGFLRISEVFYPGWQVLVDGSSVHVLRADGAWMAVNIQKGEHNVEIRAHSLFFAKASMVSFPCIALLALYWCWVIIARTRKRAS
jgi:hypothetical protein